MGGARSVGRGLGNLVRGAGAPGALCWVAELELGSVLTGYNRPAVDFAANPQLAYAVPISLVLQPGFLMNTPSLPPGHYQPLNTLLSLKDPPAD